MSFVLDAVWICDPSLSTPNLQDTHNYNYTHETTKLQFSVCAILLTITIQIMHIVHLNLNLGMSRIRKGHSTIDSTSQSTKTPGFAFDHIFNIWSPPPPHPTHTPLNQGHYKCYAKINSSETHRIQNQHTRELISAREMSHKHNSKGLSRVR